MADAVTVWIEWRGERVAVVASSNDLYATFGAIEELRQDEVKLIRLLVKSLLEQWRKERDEHGHEGNNDGNRAVADGA